MDQNEISKQIIKNYKKDEHMMILVFAQWCINNDLDPIDIYSKAYPNQPANEALTQVIELTVSKEEAGHIADETLLGVLSLFGNDDLAYVITNEINKRKDKK